MLTGFQNRTVQQKTNEEQKKRDALHAFMRQLLHEALQEAMEDNFRVHIEDQPYRVEFKFPDHHTLQSIHKILNENKLLPLESKILAAEILVHTFKIESGQIVEVLYRPVSRPRM